VRLFLDTANFKQIKHAAKLGVISGITTNPTLVAKENVVDYQAAIKEICAIIPGPVSVEVTVEGAELMIKQAQEISTWAPNIVIKIPANPDGLEATSALSQDNIKVNLTLCFSLNQTLLGALAGATYVSVFVGRLDDAGHNGMEIVKDAVDVLKHYELPTQVIAASIRHPQHCVAAAKAGAHIATVPYNVLMQMIQHPLTDVGIARFLKDWQSVAQT